MSTTIFSLERRNWRQARGLWLSLPGSDRVATFHDRAEADAEAREREWSIRRRLNPFQCGGPLLHYQTSFDAARLFDWCLDAGLDPPGLTNDSRIWADWWAVHRDDMTLAQRASVWEALDRVRFFQVRECERGMACHLVATQEYAHDAADDWGLWRYVGCVPYMLMRRSADADSLCHQLFLDNLARHGGYVGEAPPPDAWQIQDSDPFEDAIRYSEQWRQSHAERRPLDLIAKKPLHAGQLIYVVLRRPWVYEEPDSHFWRWSLTRGKSCGRPIAAFDTLAAADELQAQLESEARQTSSLFRFGPPHEWGTLHPSDLFGVLTEISRIDFTSMWTDYFAPDHNWCRWWDSVVPTLRQEEIELVWSLYDRLRFYEIVEVEYRE